MRKCSINWLMPQTTSKKITAFMDYHFLAGGTNTKFYFKGTALQKSTNNSPHVNHKEYALTGAELDRAYHLLHAQCI